MSDDLEAGIARAATTGLAVGLRMAGDRVSESNHDAFTASSLARLIADEIRAACVATIFVELKQRSAGYIAQQTSRIDAAGAPPGRARERATDHATDAQTTAE